MTWDGYYYDTQLTSLSGFLDHHRFKPYFSYVSHKKLCLCLNTIFFAFSSLPSRDFPFHVCCCCCCCCFHNRIKEFDLTRERGRTCSLFTRSKETKWKREAELPFCIPLTHEGSHREVYKEFQPSYDIFRRSGAKDCSDHRLHWLHCPIANSTLTQSQQPVNRTRLIKSSRL